MSHTPGPWSCDNEKDMFDTDERTWLVLGPDGKYLVGGIPWEHEGDARLIAAAPELLATLRLAADAIDLAQAQVDSENDRYTLCKRLVAIKRVIAKAEGIKEATTHGKDRRMD